MRIALPLTSLLLCLSCLSCAPLPLREVTAVPGPPPAGCVTSYATLGADQVRLVVDRQRGWARLDILDSDGSPKLINPHELEAIFHFADGTVREATFEPAILRNGAAPADRFILRRSWLRGPKALTLTVDIPLAGTHYRVTVECPGPGSGQPQHGA